MAHPAPAYDKAAHEMRGQLMQYLDRSGLTIGDFAKRVGYSPVALHHFVQGRYPGNPKHICDAARGFIEQHPIEAAADLEGKLYETANVRVWREIFFECLDSQRAAVVYGPPGIQKSFPVEHLIAELNRLDLAKNGHGRRAYYVYCRQGIRPNQLLKRVAEACGTSPLGDADRILRNLRFDFAKRRVLIIFDEAQHLSIDCLETVRELLDRLGCGLIFSGSHNLMRIFQKSIELEQLNSRLYHAIQLPGMTEEDARRIIGCELQNATEKQTADLIAKSSVVDPQESVRRKEEYRYISARRLFGGIKVIQERGGNRTIASSGDRVKSGGRLQ
jgi:DNA transposition AAA+ family ATPase